MLDYSKVPIHYLNQVSFSAYTTDDIKKLSVLQITNSQTFDVLGHPMKCGLYDSRLGPLGNWDKCETCFQGSLQCPGHFGYISLPLPVFSPFFIGFAYKLLKGTCLECHRLRTYPVSCLLVMSQLKALEYGLVRTANEMESYLGDLTANAKLMKDVDGMAIKQKLDHVLKQALADSEASLQDSTVKNVVECRQAILKSFMRDHVAKAPKTCTRCGTPSRTLHLEHNSRLVVGAAPVAKKIKVKKKQASKSNFHADEYGDVDVEEKDEDDDDENASKFTDSSKQVYMTAKEARDHLKELCENERDLVLHLFGALGGKNGGGMSSPVEGFFMEVLPVPPSRFRPVAKMRNEVFNNPHTGLLEKVLQCCTLINYLLVAIKSNATELNTTELNLLQVIGRTIQEKFQNAWFMLQTFVNKIFDTDLDKLDADKTPGVKQLIERKEGLFRKNMMGKRVNFAARSVISPDPYIDVDEIGIPEAFAKKLTYPQPVNPWNILELRQAVINGPDVYPGAMLIKDENGSTTILSRDLTQRQAYAKRLLTPSLENKHHGTKIVYRHLRAGDVLLLNRQPTLHKPSIMAHKVRVLPGEKTLRLNYSNCKTYNADFDGDEMNAHFPQNELARAEAYTIANVAHQYLVPKDGTPLGGLIQDHIVSAVLLMIRGKFFNREDYQQLVYGALTRKDDRIILLKPSILRPCCRWSGKQVISTVIINTIPAGQHLISLNGNSKIPPKSWKKSAARPWLAGGTSFTGNEMSESEVVIRSGELLCGILDKTHFGATPYGLVHCCYELYGGEVSTLLISQVARLFTQFLQIEGFTLGVQDILVTAKADKKRRKIMKQSVSIGDEVACEAFTLPSESTESIIKFKFAEAHLGTNDRPLKDLDMAMKGKSDMITNNINSACVPDGLIKKFPYNNLQLMVVSGAKGSSVNCMQISSLLGQIELEGRRPPLMLSGRSLPSFLPYDTSPRAGGFIDGRFLTGIRPQECFFHCMAGREGLIDTAVKTSRSGYLQRCLIKHLEGVAVAYDLTVRDSDGSVIQFQYGEDALDIGKLQFLKKNHLNFLVENHKAIYDETACRRVLDNCDYDAVIKKTKRVRKYLKKHAGGSTSRTSGFLNFSGSTQVDLDSHTADLVKKKLVDGWFRLDPAERAAYSKTSNRLQDPINSVYRADLDLGAISEKMDSLIQSYISSSPGLKMKHSEVAKILHYKVLSSFCEPGEAVGLLAAQSVGEPSTQMTLNTFHFAGRGEMNVTLGIPRLREILMVASANIATPALEVPFLPVRKLDKKAERLKRKFSRIYLHEVLQTVDMRETLVMSSSQKVRQYKMSFQFLPYKQYKKERSLKPSQILYFMETVFFKHLITVIKTKLHIITKSSLVSNVTVRPKQGPMAKGADEEGDEGILRKDTLQDEGESSADEEGPETDAGTARNKAQHDQEREYEELDDEDREIQQLNDESDNENVAEDTLSISPVPESLPDSLSDYKGGESNPSAENDFLSRQEKLKEGMRIEDVLGVHDWITGYKYDVKEEEWCEVTISMDIELKKVDMGEILKEEVRKSVVHHTKGINMAYVTNESGPDGTSRKVLKTDGINITEMFKYDTLLDLNRLYCNDIHAFADTYGIEAASRVILKEVQKVFGVYGIEVDPRHLLLIADYMTFDGKYKPFNRLGLESNASPLQQMSFETTMHFLRMATVSGQLDTLKSPSSRLVIGRPVGCGTGCFDLIQPLKI